MFRSLGKSRVLLIALVLLFAIVAPAVAEGYLYLGRAQAAGTPALAAPNYESAARLLLWQPHLWEKAALAYVAAGEMPHAVLLLERARLLNALSAGGWDHLGAAYWEQSRYQQASEAWSAGLQRYPGHLEFYSRLALAYRASHQANEERQALEKWVPAGRASALEHFRLGELLLASDSQRARAELATAASADAAFQPAVQTLTAALDAAASQPSAAARLIVLGRGLALVNDWSLAQQAFEQAAAADANNAQAWAWFGEAQQQTSTGDGRSALNRALSLDPQDTLVRALRGLYWKRQGQYGAEVVEYKAAAQLDPGNPQWQTALGEAYSLAGDQVSALAAYQKATALAPDNATYWRLLAMFCADNTVQVLDVGVPAAQKAADLAPKDAQVQDALGWAYAQAGLLYKAQQALTEAITLDPALALPHLHLAEAELRSGDATAAYRHLKLAQQLDPDGPVGALAGQLLAKYFP